ncbi:MAG: hypothetical protein ABIT83_26145 [Massilia sp.]
MDQLPTNACLAEIHQLWLDAKQDLRPPSVWIAEHAPVSASTDDPETPVVNAWFMDASGIAARRAIDFVRFITAHSGLPGASGACIPPAIGIFNNRSSRIHTIGLAAFAPIRDSELIYLHHIWGGTSGRGGKYLFDSEKHTLACVQNVWLS